MTRKQTVVERLQVVAFEQHLGDVVRDAAAARPDVESGRVAMQVHKLGVGSS
jgi:hypothetical protein